MTKYTLEATVEVEADDINDAINKLHAALEDSAYEWPYVNITDGWSDSEPMAYINAQRTETDQVHATEEAFNAGLVWQWVAADDSFVQHKIANDQTFTDETLCGLTPDYRMRADGEWFLEHEREPGDVTECAKCYAP